MHIKLDIDLSLTPRAKKSIRWLLLPFAVFAGTVAIANAYDTSWVQSGHAVSAGSLKGNLDEIQTRLATLETQTTARRPPTVSYALNPGSASGNSGGAFASGIYTTPAGVLWLEVEMVGGGGGGGPSGTTPGTSGNPGGDTNFGETLLVAYGGKGGANCAVNGDPAGGGSISIVTSKTVLQVKALVGGSGGIAGNIAPISYTGGGAGGVNALGGGGFGAGVASTGSGGSGAPSYGPGSAGQGGGAGGYVHAIVIPTAGQTFLYSVGEGGAGGIAGTSGAGGGAGGTGAIYVTEHYQ